MFQSCTLGIQIISFHTFFLACLKLEINTHVSSFNSFIQDLRVGAIPPKFLSPGHAGGSSMRPGNAMPNTYSHATFPNASPVRPPPRKFGAPDSPNISVDAYRQRHEVTASVTDHTCHIIHIE